AWSIPNSRNLTRRPLSQRRRHRCAGLRPRGTARLYSARPHGRRVSLERSCPVPYAVSSNRDALRTDPDMKLRRAFALLLATFAVVGCDQGRDAPQRTAIAVMNAAPGFRGLQFTRGQPTRTNQPTGLSFQGSFATQWDVDTYNIRL